MPIQNKNNKRKHCKYDRATYNDTDVSMGRQVDNFTDPNGNLRSQPVDEE